MPVNIQRVLPVLENMELFSGFTQDEITQIAGRFSERTFQPDEILVNKLNAEGNLYIVVEGRVSVRNGGEPAPFKQEILDKGNFFEEDAVLFGKPDTASISADVASILLFLDSEAYPKLLADYPKIKPNLGLTSETSRLVTRQNFDWVGEGEVIYFLARKHKALLAISLIGPLLLLLIAGALSIGLSSSDIAGNFWIAGVSCSSIMAFGALLWGLWNWIDWGNDFYIVTNQRVVWVEKVIWLYESRDEAPLNTILSVNVTTSLLGRILDFGNVVVRTFTGQIIFRNLRDYDRMVSVINEYRQRMQRRSEIVEKREIDKAIRLRLGLLEAETMSSVSAVQHTQTKKPGFYDRYFRDMFTMRFERGNVITFRKYWPTLLAKVWAPSLLILIIFVGIGFLINSVLVEGIQQPWLSILVVLLFAFLVFGILWWIYQYADWRNDIYQVTDKFIFDIERKPLGTEVKKSAPLENILSLEHERVGLLGYLLNYGKVVINVGETRFIFNMVHDPARVQQDIFTRIHAQRRQKEIADAARERKRLVDVLGYYHQAVGEIREEEYYEDEYEEEYDDDEMELE